MSTNPNMEAIETITATTSVASIEFTNIPQGYTDLQIVLSGRQSVAGGTNVNMKFNGSSSGYTNRNIISAAGTVASESTVLGTSSIKIGFIPDAVNYTVSTFSNQYVYIPNYAGSNYKSVSTDNAMENNSTTVYFGLFAGLWSNSSAITSIALTCETGNFVQYSSATLYGITNAAVGAKATGGIISETDTHWIHTFTASGTFTPTASLTADYLVVAGGAGGGADGGGGGGAGGLRSTVTATGGGGSLESALSLTAQAYTVTVGAGGAGSSNVANRGSNGSNSVFSSITSTGGGGGGSESTSVRPGVSGGSGGGGRMNSASSGGAGTANQGYAGGSSTSGKGAGGGGGAGAVGADGIDGPSTQLDGGNGGAGVAVAISGSSVTYAGGGGGGAADNASAVPGTGGAGGGGAGGRASSGVAGTANTGGGGGGDGGDAGRASGGSGGSGIVIVRYAK